MLCTTTKVHFSKRNFRKVSLFVMVKKVKSTALGANYTGIYEEMKPKHYGTIAMNFMNRGRFRAWMSGDNFWMNYI